MLSRDSIYQQSTKTKDFHWEFRDKHWLISWDLRDLPTVFNFCKAVRESERAKREELLDLFGSTLDRKYNDHHIPIDAKLVPESLDQVVTEDILTFKGIARFCQLICLQSNKTGHTVAIGSGVASPQAFDSQLEEERANVQVSESGFFDPSGIRIWYGGTFGQSLQTAQYTESCLRDQTSVNGAIVFSRNTFTDNFMDHVQGNSGFTAAGVYEFIPIA